MANKSETTSAKPGISRRTVVQGTAWAVPAVVVATAAPAAAAGTSQCLTASFDSTSCKQPGGGKNNFGFNLKICFTNTCTSAATITVTQIKGNTGNAPIKLVGQTITVQPNQQGCLPANVVYCSVNSADKIDVSFTVNSGPVQVQTVDSPPQDCATDPILCPK